MKINTKNIIKKVQKVTSRISFDWVFNKKVLVVISVLISLVMWFFVTLNVSTDETKTFYNIPIKIDEEALDAKGLRLVQVTSGGKLADRLIDVELSGNRFSLGQVSEDDIKVVAQVSDVVENKKGEYKLSLKITCGSLFNTTPTTNNTSSINVYLDVMSTNTFPVGTPVTKCSAVSGIVDGVDYGDSYIVDTPTALIDGERIKTLTLEGPQDVMASIAAVQVYADGAKNMTQTEKFDGTVTLLDAYGNQLSDTDMKYISAVKYETANSMEYIQGTLDDFAVTVEVPIKKTFSLLVQARANKEKYGSGFIMPPLTITPDSIPVKCLPNNSNYISNSDVINNIYSIDVNFAEDISISNSKISTSYDFPSDLEGSGSYAGTESAEIDLAFNLKGYESRRITLPLSAVNLAYDQSQGVTVTPQDESISVTFIGPRQEVRKLTAERLTIVLKLDSNMEPGITTNVPCSIYINGSTHCWASGEFTLSVKLAG